MSLTKLVDVRCDGCSQLFDNATWTGVEVRADARVEGWRTNLPGGRDLCPDCRGAQVG